MFEDAGIKQGFTENYSDYVKRAITQNRVALQAVIDSWNRDVETSTDGIQSLAEAYIGNAILDGGYKNITPAMQTIINSVIGSYDFDYYNQFKIIHEGETYTYLGEKDGYYKIQVGGKTGWVNSQYMKINGFSQGGFIADLQKVAYQNGDDILSFNTLKRGEAVLNTAQTAQFKRLTDSLPQLQGIIDVSKHVEDMRAVDKSSHGNINISFDGGINIPIERVLDYNDFVRKLRDDKTFERMIGSMTIDKLVGKSNLAKKKYYD